MAKKTYDDDDGRVVADMSDIERQPLVVPRFDRLHKKPESSDKNEEEKTLEMNELSGKEKSSFIAGALGATLLIGSVFAIVGAVVIFLITRMG